MHTIRKAMGNRDGLYEIKGTIEFGEAYVKKSTPESTKLKRGNGSQGVQNGALAGESTLLVDI